MVGNIYGNPFPILPVSFSFPPRGILVSIPPPILVVCAWRRTIRISCFPPTWMLPVLVPVKMPPRMIFAWVHIPLRVLSVPWKPRVPIQIRAINKLFRLSVAFVVPPVFIPVMPVALYPLVITLYVVHVPVVAPLPGIPPRVISVMIVSPVELMSIFGPLQVINFFLKSSFMVFFCNSKTLVVHLIKQVSSIELFSQLSFISLPITKKKLISPRKVVRVVPVPRVGPKSIINSRVVMVSVKWVS